MFQFPSPLFYIYIIARFNVLVKCFLRFFNIFYKKTPRYCEYPDGKNHPTTTNKGEFCPFILTHMILYVKIGGIIMATAKKRGNSYRVRVYDKDTKKYKSFTAATKREAERLANEWLNGKPDETNGFDFETAANEYVKAKSDVLSPTTIQGYRTILRNNCNRILDIKLSDINHRLVQDWINELTVNKSPKTVHNVYGFFTAVLSYNDCSIKLSKVRLPQKCKTFKRLPSPQVVIDTFKGSEIEIPVLLGIWCGMRISEILGIRKCDIDGDVLTINQVLVTVDNEPTIKQNAKTYNSNRQIKLPRPILDLIYNYNTDINNKEPIIKLTRKQIYGRFVKAMTKQGYKITFHDLRHINASVMAALKVPDIYAMERGGWSNTSTLKGIYQQTFDSDREKVDSQIDSYFTKIYDQKYDHKKIKAE